jgi:hypothetical protein
LNQTAKQCGDCSLCCKVLVIPELDKPKDKWCPNFAPGTGCRVYAERPTSCRNFVCRWLVDPTLGPEWKPSLCKMVLDVKPGMLVVHADPAVSKPWRAEPYNSILKTLAVQGLTSGTVVMVMERNRCIAILPDREEDLGVIGPGARLKVAREITLQGARWQVRVMPPQEVSKP